jgi:uncharacterized protein YqhQ
LRIIAGNANMFGFMVEVEEVNLTRKFYTKNYSKSKVSLAMFFLSVFVATLLSVYIFSPLIRNIAGHYFALMNFFELSSSIRIYLTILSVAISMPLALNLISLNVLRWHSCEHKLNNLLEFEKEMELSLIRDESPFRPNCGSRFMIYAVFTSLFMLLLAPVYNNFLIIIPAMMLGFFLNKTTSLSWYLQNYLLTRNPKEYQYFETLELGKEIRTWSEEVRKNYYMNCR